MFIRLFITSLCRFMCCDWSISLYGLPHTKVCFGLQERYCKYLTNVIFSVRHDSYRTLFSLGFKACMLSTWAMNLSTKNLVHDSKYLVSKRYTDQRVRFFWLNFICLCCFLFVCFYFVFLCVLFFFSKIDYGINNMNVMMTINCGDLSRFSHGKHVVCILTQYS